ncbi:MAG: serine--tRNA ligase [Bacteroidales bacterium]|jgi:seryl-tRNA synthetase|nr:serine--tRNA ligase [Bacteroidales bacterium]
MLQISRLRSEPENIIRALAVKNFDASGIIKEILTLDETRRSTQKNMDDLLAESNKMSKETGELFKTGKAEEANKLKEKSAELKNKIKELEEMLRAAESEQNNKLLLLPNIPHNTVKPGKSSEENEIIFNEGNIPVLPEDALPHWDLAAKYGLIDFELGNKITGAGFPVYIGKGAKLQRALIQFFLDSAIDEGYTEIQPPLMVNEASAYGTGQLPDKEGQMYHVPLDNLFLIPTAEVPITNLYRDNILKESDFPIKNVAYSACFRREAGSYGKDVRGLNRLHEFDKVEIVQIQHPDKSYETLEAMCKYVSSLLNKLNLPYRIVKLCGGDLSFASAMTYDFEVYSAAQKRWLEVSSVSNFESFQSNRMKLRFRNADGKISLAHTLNGSALALPRIVASLLENNQEKRGVLIPEILHKYTTFEIIN